MAKQEKEEKEYDYTSATYVRNLLYNDKYNKQIIESMMDYEPKNDDILLCSHFKTGSTLMQYTIWMILHQDKPLPNLNDMLTKNAPFVLLSEVEKLNSLPHPRFYKTHFPYDKMVINIKAKYVYIYRNPRDVVVSFFLFYKELWAMKKSFDQHFDEFLKGLVEYGCYFDNVISFYRHKNESHVLLISYEDFVCDKRSHILKIAQFLGDKYHKRLVDNIGNLEAIVNMTDFNYMKTNIDTAFDGKKFDMEGINNLKMFRKGIIGDGKNWLTDDQMEKLKLKIQEKMKGTSLINEWLPL